MQPWIDATQFQLRALSIGKGYSMQKYSSLQREGKTLRGLNGKISGWGVIFDNVNTSAESAAFSGQCEYNFK